MRVFVNGRFLTQPVSGVQRYARSILGALDGMLLASEPVEVLVPDAPLHDVPEWRNLALRRVPGGQGHLWEQGVLYRASRDGVLVSLGNSGPLRHRRQVLALHDAHLYQIPEAFSWRYRVVHRLLRPRLARRAAGLVTVSAYSAGQLARHLGVPEERFTVIPNAASHVFDWPADPSAPGRYGLEAGRYLLAVGNQSPNKNIAGLVAAYGACEGLPDLAVVGGAVPGVASQPVAGVRALGRVPDTHLRGLYEGAAGFVFPSLYEGFGIPPLEAMALGVPVICSRTAALPEVLGDAPIWFDPRDQASIVKALQRFSGLSRAERVARIAAGRAQAARFSWEDSAGALWDLVARVARSEPLEQHVRGAGDLISLRGDVPDLP